jgi:hypothetical protein
MVAVLLLFVLALGLGSAATGERSAPTATLTTPTAAEDIDRVGGGACTALTQGADATDGGAGPCDPGAGG